MTLTDPAVLLFALGALGYVVFVLPSQKAMQTAQKDLTPDDLQTYSKRYRKRADRADMPTRFKPLADASSRYHRRLILSAIASGCALIWYALTGPNLGLFPL